MPRLAFAAVACALAVAACGGDSAPAPKRPTAAGVSVQPGDLPQGLVRCDVSGDIGSFIEKEGAGDAAVAQSAADEWAQARAGGATAAYVAIYADSSGHCDQFKAAGTNPATAGYRLVITFVLQFKDEKSAVTVYQTQPIFGISVSSLRSSSQAIEGAKTGIAPNSIVISQPIANQSFYVALWQNKAFDVLLVALNFDPAASKKIATSENSRIR